MEPPYLQQFLTHEFSHQCVKSHYCFRCSLPFCSHCCPDHYAHHPPHAQRHVAQIRSIGGHIMINAEDSRGVGYDWRRIQWVRSEGHRWMHLQRPMVAVPYPDYPHQCVHCQDKRKANFDFCAIACQVDHVHDANGIAQATELLAADWGQLNCDTYCTRCRKSFPAVYCDAHVEVHHQNQVAATIPVFHHQGWALVAANDPVLPPVVLEGVQVVEVNGVAMHPIRCCPLQQQVPPIANAMHPCAGPCVEGVPAGAHYCSILCGRQAAVQG